MEKLSFKHSEEIKRAVKEEDFFYRASEIRKIVVGIW
jgi:hypothetical protein